MFPCLPYALLTQVDLHSSFQVAMSNGSTAMGYAYNFMSQNHRSNHFFFFTETAEGKVNRSNAAAFAAAAAAGQQQGS